MRRRVGMLAMAALAGVGCRPDDSEVLCQHATRRDASRLFIELTAAALDDLRRELDARGAPAIATWWGYDTLQVDDPDGNELLFPIPA